MVQHRYTLLIMISVVDALEKLCVEASTLGLKLSWPKTKLQNLGVGPPMGGECPTFMNSVVIDNVTVEGVEKFIYLGSQQGPVQATVGLI